MSKKIPWQEYIRLYTLEATLRWLIKYHLEQQKITRERISDILGGAEGKKEKQREMEKEGKVPKTRYVDFVGYMDFPNDYIEIIKRNWPIFESIFQYKGRLIDGLKVLGPLRHNIAHMRPLNDEQIYLLKATSRRMIKHIWDYINEKYVNPAQKYEKEESYEKAKEILRKGLEETRNELLYDKGDPWIAYNLGKLFKKWGKSEEAKKWLEYAEKNMPLSPYRELVERVLKTIEGS